MENENIKTLTDPKQKQVLSFFIITLIFFVGVLSLYIFLFLKKNKTITTKPTRIERPETEFFEKKSPNSEIIKTTENPKNIVLTDLDLAQDDTQSIGKVLQGYSDSYDPSQQIFKLKNKLVRSTTLQLLETSTKEITQFYCWPDTISSKNGPVEVQSLQIFVEPDGRDVIMPTEKIIPLDQLEIFLKKDHYIILQLKQIFDINKTNAIQKLIIVGC
ncbi:MAG: hypothetical protein HN981_01450 [Candidatus Pacebacteria bacterium]|nr:hypothetical protein [Candidatus Paceibacterota bacterium]MBT4652671.1 hypothetical protein [Candidatus Paceibacterota bacterium]MBT6755828.1 hypothetical protein [Candidatus Paceibacterota bacterium]MBT6921041.1 hypothetical protein [Candidatus Paceibacterota bacterium]